MLFPGRIRPLATITLMTSLLASPFAILSASAENRIDTQRPDAPELAAYGNYDVGTRPVYLTNPNQLDVLALDASVEAPDPLPTYDRELVVQMWYPAYPGATGGKTLRAFL